MVAAGFEEFIAIIDCGSVTKAAQTLGLPRPTVSKRLARLEEHLGVRLLHRTTRRMKLTKHGELFYEKARRVVHSAREAEAAVRRLDDKPRGLLRMVVPSRIPEGPFMGWLAEFLEKYPEVRLDVVSTEEHIDLVAEGFDVALRYGAIEDASLISRILATNADIAIASPQYLDEHGAPAEAADLGHHNCIIGYKGSNVPEPRWPLLDGGWIAVTGTIVTNHAGLRLEAAKRHLGIAIINNYVAREALAEGDVVHVLPDIVGCPDYARLVYPDRKFVEPKIRAFVDFIALKVQG